MEKNRIRIRLFSCGSDRYFFRVSWGVWVSIKMIIPEISKIVDFLGILILVQSMLERRYETCSKPKPDTIIFVTYNFGL